MRIFENDDESDYSKKGEIETEIILDLEEALDDSDFDDKETERIANTIKSYWENYLNMDKRSISKYISSNVRKMTQFNKKLSDGSEEFLDDLTLEWTEYERPDNKIAARMEIYDLTILEDSSDYAIAYYWMEVEGGVRWQYSSNKCVLQIFENQDGDWKLIHHIDGSADDDDDEEDDEFELNFEYAYPVNNLDRAVKFYTPILGKPDFVNDTMAYFRLNDPGFFLDATGLFGYAEVRKKKPNGFPIIYVKNLAQETERLKENDVDFLENTDSKPKKWNGDPCALIKDLDGNVLLLVERVYRAEEGTSSVTGFKGDSKYVEAAEAVASAWMNLDKKTLSSMNGEDGYWFDCSRITTFGIHDGKEEIINYLEKHYWKNLDHTDECIAGTWHAENLKEVSLSDYTVISYEREFTGNGRHPVKFKSFVTHIFESSDELIFTFINNSTVCDGMVLDLDNTEHPVRNIEKAEKFYSEQLEFGEPYSDEDYRGYWSDNSVHGIYEADEEDDLIHDEKTNGLLSFDVLSAKETYEYLQKQEVEFPVIPSQNDKKGMDEQNGYIQIVATDSEGNLVTFSEYTGKRKK